MCRSNEQKNDTSLLWGINTQYQNSAFFKNLVKAFCFKKKKKILVKKKKRSDIKKSQMYIVMVVQLCKILLFIVGIKIKADFLSWKGAALVPVFSTVRVTMHSKLHESKYV